MHTGMCTWSKKGVSKHGGGGIIERGGLFVACLLHRNTEKNQHIINKNNHKCVCRINEHSQVGILQGNT